MNQMNKRGVFGLSSVQLFFAAILGIGLLAYVIVTIMGTLGGTTILQQATYSSSVINETGYLNQTGYTLAQSTLASFSPTITAILNATDNTTILAGNYTVTNGILKNATATTWSSVRITYTYSYLDNSGYQNNLNSILGNTSTGITGFFSSVNPVYAILAILVIILVLIVLVRIVQTPGTRENTQL